MSQTLIRDWAHPRSACAFTGYVGNAKDGQGGPSGSLLLCVNTTPIPCQLEGMESQKVIQFTVLNIRKAGWSYAPWKRSTKAAKVVKDDNAKPLFENGSWANNDVTMERVLQSVKMYSFAKDGQNKGDRTDTFNLISAGLTFRVALKDFMFETKKLEDQSVFPPGVDVIPPYSVVEVMINASHTTSCAEGYAFNVGRIRQCDFSLYSMHHTLGLGMLPRTYDESVRAAELNAETYADLRKVIETRNTGFFGRVAQGSYLTKFSDDIWRLVGPKEDPQDPQSRHLSVMEGVFAIDIHKEHLFQFTNAVERDDADAVAYARTLVDLASAGGALDCFVIYNEYRLRSDPNKSPFTGVPLVDSKRFLEFIQPPAGLSSPTRFPLPFDVPGMEQPYVTLHPQAQARTDGGRLLCPDFVLGSESIAAARLYMLSLGDSVADDFMRLAFLPKTGASGQPALERPDYHQYKRQRVAPSE